MLAHRSQVCCLFWLLKCVRINERKWSYVANLVKWTPGFHRNEPIAACNGRNLKTDGVIWKMLRSRIKWRLLVVKNNGIVHVQILCRVHKPLPVKWNISIPSFSITSVIYFRFYHVIRHLMFFHKSKKQKPDIWRWKPLALLCTRFLLLHSETFSLLTELETSSCFLCRLQLNWTEWAWEVWLNCFKNIFNHAASMWGLSELTLKRGEMY